MTKAIGIEKELEEETDKDYLNIAAQDILLEEIAEHRAFLYKMWEVGIDPEDDEEGIIGKYDQELVQAAIDLNNKYYHAALSGRSVSEHSKVIRLYKVLNSDVMERDFEYMALLK
jgi:hypothetical protein